MKSMKLTASEAKHESMLMCCDSKPTYPYGLQISLNDESLEKLALAELPDVGIQMTLTAKVTVTAVSSNQQQGKDGETMKPNNRVELQITDMDISSGEEAGETSITEKLYG